MKVKTLFKLALQRLKYNKKRNFIIIIVMMLIAIIILFLGMIQYSISKYVESMENNMELRTLGDYLYIPSKYQEIKNTINNIENVEMVVDEFERTIHAGQESKQLQKNGTTGTVFLKPANSKSCPEVIEGRKISNNDKYVIILPNKIYANNQIEGVDNQIKESDYISGEDFLGKELSIEFKTDEKTEIIKFEVIGIYDSEKYNDVSTPYIPMNTVKMINEQLGYEPKAYFMTIVVDKIENLEKVQKELYNAGIIQETKIEEEASEDTTDSNILETNFSHVTNISLKTLNIIKNVLVVALLSSAIILLFLLIITNINKTYLLKTDLGILKIEGYTNKDIQKIIILENIFLCLISIIFAFIGFKILQLIMNIIFENIIQTNTVGITAMAIKEQIYYISKIPQSLDIKFSVISMALFVIIEIASTYLINKKILKKNIKKILE